ncbi:unnamed protein product [Allacma fusca]|uniref:Sugar phosphate transporter domain-containing protein n=1 Tax=Allacma fusca TaxID=39272 RepID=A0A8J2KVS4_9HEXA|nr:unnamed protein product [Allacma fusca]
MGERDWSQGLGYQYISIFTVVACYWVISILTVFVNKSLLSAQHDFDAPLFVTWFQCVFTVAVCFLMKRLSLICGRCGLSQFPNQPYNFKLLVKILPLSIIFVGMITFNNLCLKYVNVAFYYLARSLTTVTNVIFTFILLHQRVSGKAILCCLVITLGYFLGIEEELFHASLTFNGVVFGILSSCCVSLNSIYTKKVLPIVDNSAWTLTFYNNVNASLLFIPLIYFVGEFPERIIVHEIESVHFWLLMVVGGICGVSIGFVTAMQIKLTSPLTHNISGTAKACAQTVIAVWSYNDIKPWMWWCSNWIVLIGSGLYARVQQLDMERLYKDKKSKTLPLSTDDAVSKQALLGDVDEERDI